MATIVTRAGKGSALTFTEGDNNFINLNTDKLESTDLSVTTGIAAGGGTLSYNAGVFTFQPADTSSLLSNVVEDTTPTLGGDLDAASFKIANADLDGYRETIHPLTFAATIAPNVINGNVQTMTATGDFTFNGFTSPVAGQSVTLIVTQDPTGSRLMTSSMLFAGGEKTLSTAGGAIDIISVTFDGSVYYASLAKGFA